MSNAIRFGFGLALAMTLAAPALAGGDPAEGEKVFKKCKACHMVGDGAKNRIGPVLTGIVGAPAGRNPDFKYSAAMTEAAAGGLVWTEENLDKFLKKPKDFLKGTKMTFAGLRKDDQRADVIAYLGTFH